MAESAVEYGAQSAPTPFAPGQRKKAIAALLVVTSVWGATFIWMKQALNELQPEIEAYGSNRVVGVLVAARFAIAALVMVVFFPRARAALGDKEQWKGGALLGGVMLVGFVTQMIGLDEINPAVSAFLTSLYVVFTALITIFMTKSQPSRVLMFGVLLATFGAGFIQGPPPPFMGLWRSDDGGVRRFLCLAHHLHPEDHSSDGPGWCNTNFVRSRRPWCGRYGPAAWRWAQHRRVAFYLRRWRVYSCALFRHRGFVLLFTFAQHVPALFAPNSSRNYLCT